MIKKHSTHTPKTQLFDRNKNLICEENGKKSTLQTGNVEWHKIPLDEIYQQHKTGNQHQKCDFIILSITKTIQMYVELKGKDFKKTYTKFLKHTNIFKKTGTTLRHNYRKSGSCCKYRSTKQTN